MSKQKKKYTLPPAPASSVPSEKDKGQSVKEVTRLPSKGSEDQELNKRIQKFLKKSIAKMEEVNDKVRKDFPKLFD